MLVLSTDTPQGQWPLGCITKMVIWSDDQVCLVNLEVGQKVLTNSAHKLVQLKRDGQIDKS